MLAVVTGAAGGIGLETARELARKGAHVVVTARDEARARAAAEEVARGGGHAEPLGMDMGSFVSVREGAQRLSRSHESIDVVVNNAGIVVRDRRRSVDGHELTWQTNFLSAYLLTRMLLPALTRSLAARVVNVSSEAHKVGRIDWDDLETERGRFSGFRAYANTKLALVLFTRELARREPRVAVNALHPGAIATGIWRAAPAVARWVLSFVLPPASAGARPVVRLASAPELDGVSGRYFDRFRAVEPAPAARNDADAARLWRAAEEAVGLPPT